MMGEWTFFSNYGHVLVCLAGNREARLRDVAEQVGITERAVQKIVRDLQSAGYITVSKRGRCNRYRINRRKSLRHGLESHCTVGKLLSLISKTVADVEPEAVDRVAPAKASAPSGQLAKPSVQAADEPPATKASRKENKAAKAASESREQGSLF